MGLYPIHLMNQITISSLVTDGIKVSPKAICKARTCGTVEVGENVIRWLIIGSWI
ncbi:hypothetical protein [Bacillus cereus]|uniref:hypothetical protein n=1 Tax=Bacillus cereus TaxID=1396 RepID=UPI001596FDBA|nr:hypothetical protein [Bacillus cereus]